MWPVLSNIIKVKLTKKYFLKDYQSNRILGIANYFKAFPDYFYLGAQLNLHSVDTSVLPFYLLRLFFDVVIYDILQDSGQKADCVSSG